MATVLMKRCLETDTHRESIVWRWRRRQLKGCFHKPGSTCFLDRLILAVTLFHLQMHTHTYTSTCTFPHMYTCSCVHAHTNTHMHIHTLKSNLTLYEVLPKTRLLTEVAWFAQLWECPSVTWEGSILLPSIRINQMVLSQLPAMGPANSHVHFYMAFCMGWEETSIYPSGSYLSSCSEVIIYQCFKRKIHGYEVIIWPKPQVITVILILANGGFLIDWLE